MRKQGSCPALSRTFSRSRHNALLFSATSCEYKLPGLHASGSISGSGQVRLSVPACTSRIRVAGLPLSRSLGRGAPGSQGRAAYFPCEILNDTANLVVVSDSYQSVEFPAPMCVIARELDLRPNLMRIPCRVLQITTGLLILPLTHPIATNHSSLHRQDKTW